MSDTSQIDAKKTRADSSALGRQWETRSSDVSVCLHLWTFASPQCSSCVTAPIGPAVKPNSRFARRWTRAAVGLRSVDAFNVQNCGAVSVKCEILI